MAMLEIQLYGGEQLRSNIYIPGNITCIPSKQFPPSQVNTGNALRLFYGCAITFRPIDLKQEDSSPGFLEDEIA